jgi:hypothetical protein
MSSIFFYIYATLVSFLDNRYGIQLPGTTPSFHYFFYLKAAQSVFFGIGFVFLLTKAFAWARSWPVGKSLFAPRFLQQPNWLVILTLACAIAYFPFYQKRADFVVLKDQAIEKQNKKSKIEAYDFILAHIPEEGVILCENDPSLFPVMATARKMVSTAFTFSNPYLDFSKRENDRNAMLAYLKSGAPLGVKSLFKEYGVGYVLLSKKALSGNPARPSELGPVLFDNLEYLIFRVPNQQGLP